MPRSLVALVLFSLTTSAFAASELRFVEIHSPRHFFFEPGATVVYEFAVSAIGDPAGDVVLTMPLPPGARFLDGDGHPPFLCSEAAGTVTCRATRLGGYTNVFFRIAAPSAPGRFVTRARLSARDVSAVETDFALDVYRSLVVTTTEDSGSGSLREAIEQMNATCGNEGGPCRVTFDLGEEPATIVLRSPLPEITACRSIIEARADDVWPHTAPRRVAIRGDLLSHGEGLRIHSACDPSGVVPNGVTVRGLGIHGFPANGILFAESEHKPYPTRHLVAHADVGGNGLRGIASFNRNAGLSVQRSVLRENHHSGIFLWAGISPSVTECVMRDNGRSGVFTLVPYTTLARNEITGNDDFGIAIARGVRYVTVSLTTMYGNRNVGIDRGLDGPTRRGTSSEPNAPAIADARYDAASNRTRISVTFEPSESPFGNVVRLTFYTSREVSPSGYVEAERIVGWGEMHGPARVFEVTGDLRGQFVTAMANLYGVGDEPWGDATELSEGVLVR